MLKTIYISIREPVLRIFLVYIMRLIRVNMIIIGRILNTGHPRHPRKIQIY